MVRKHRGMMLPEILGIPLNSSELDSTEVIMTAIEMETIWPSVL